jgi:hypothetical protein
MHPTNPLHSEVLDWGQLPFRMVNFIAGIWEAEN